MATSLAPPVWLSRDSGPGRIKSAGTPDDSGRRDALPWVRLGVLVTGLSLLTLAGGALLPEALTRTTAEPTTAEAGTPTDSPGATAPLSPEAARAMERPARDAPARDLVPAHAALQLAEIAGIPEPCTPDFDVTEDMSTADISRRAQELWGLELTGPQWEQDEYRPVVTLFAETIDSVDCTDYLDRVKRGNGGTLEISSLPTRSWAWGDYGLTSPKVLTLDFAKFRQGYADGDRGRLVRLIIHEMAHSLNADRYSEPEYWQRFTTVWNGHGPVSEYGSTPTESFADAVGYYVARCAEDNPFDDPANRAYYDYVKVEIFGGREFGGAVGTPQYCAVKGR